ncbi:hypothetical protein ACNKHO_25060 [Shigella flexneri]
MKNIVGHGKAGSLAALAQSVLLRLALFLFLTGIRHLVRLRR